MSVSIGKKAPKVGNKAKGRRASKMRGYYKVRFHKTAANKAKRRRKVEARKALWVKRGVKKNGEAVKG